MSSRVTTRMMLVKLGAMGDVVQAATAVSAYKHQKHGAEVHWVVGKGLANFVRGLGVADRVIEVEERELFTGSFWKRCSYLLRVIARLAIGSPAFDRVVTAYHDPRYRLLTLFVRARRKVSFSVKAARLMPSVSRNRVYEYWRLLSASDRRAEFSISQEMKHLGDRFLAHPLPDHSEALVDSLPGRYVVLVPGGARNLLRSDGLRRWPLANYRILAERLIALGHAVVLVGDKQDGYVRDGVAGLNYVDLIGATTLPELLHVLDRASAVVSHDTGPLHLACMTRTPLVALFGPTSANACVPADRPRTRVLRVGNTLPCSPCYDGNSYAECDMPKCLSLLDAAMVTGVVTDLLKEHAQHVRAGLRRAGMPSVN